MFGDIAVAMSLDGERIGEGSQKSSIGSGLAGTGGAERGKGRTQMQPEAGLEDSRGGEHEGTEGGTQGGGGVRHPGPQSLTGVQTVNRAEAEEDGLSGLASAAGHGQGSGGGRGRALLSWCEGTVTTSCPFVFIV